MVHPPADGGCPPEPDHCGHGYGAVEVEQPERVDIPAAKEPGDPDFRAAFVSPEGFYLLGGDYETMEFRIAIEIFQDAVGKLMIESGADAHGFTAAMMFHIRRDSAVQEATAETALYERGTMKVEITLYKVPQSWSDEQIADFALTKDVQGAVKGAEQKITRVDAKTVSFLWLFQGTAFTLAQRTGLPLKLCEDFFKRFASTYKGLDKGMKGMAELAVTENVVQAANGDLYAYTTGYGGIRRWVKLPQSPHYEWFDTQDAYKAAEKAYQRLIRRCQRELCNLPMQGSNAVITAEALVDIADQGEETGVYPWLSIYDEIVCVAPDSVAPETVKAIGETAMMKAANHYMKFVSAGVEFDVEKAGKYWRKS